MEFVVVELALNNFKSTLLYTSYRLPDTCPDAIQQLNKSLQDTPESSCVILIGDFNLLAINWSLNHPTPTMSGGQLEESFCDLVSASLIFCSNLSLAPLTLNVIHSICCYETALK